MQLVGKEKLPSGRYKKIYAKDPKPPYQRLLESVDLRDESKAEVCRRAQRLNPVTLKRELDAAGERLLKLSVIQSTIASEKVS